MSIEQNAKQADLARSIRILLIRKLYPNQEVPEEQKPLINAALTLRRNIDLQDPRGVDINGIRFTTPEAMRLLFFYSNFVGRQTRPEVPILVCNPLYHIGNHMMITYRGPDTQIDSDSVQTPAIAHTEAALQKIEESLERKRLGESLSFTPRAGKLKQSDTIYESD